MAIKPVFQKDPLPVFLTSFIHCSTVFAHNQKKIITSKLMIVFTMERIVTISKVEFLEVNPLFESELKLFFPLDDDECYTLIPGSKKELCRLFSLQYNDSDECDFKDIRGKKCKVDTKDGSCTFVECVNE